MHRSHVLHVLILIFVRTYHSASAFSTLQLCHFLFYFLSFSLTFASSSHTHIPIHFLLFTILEFCSFHSFSRTYKHQQKHTHFIVCAILASQNSFFPVRTVPLYIFMFSIVHTIIITLSSLENICSAFSCRVIELCCEYALGFLVPIGVNLVYLFMAIKTSSHLIQFCICKIRFSSHM